MIYRFVIQASNPRSFMTFDAGDQSLSDAIQTVFPLEAEYAVMVWNWIYIPLSYKYDVSMMADDIIDLIESMLSRESDKQTLQWPSNTFAATWTVEWGNGTTTVHAEWGCVLGETEPLLATRPTVRLATTDFIGEWKRLLEVVTTALKAAGYTPMHLAGLRRLDELVGRINRYGLMYRD